MNANFTIIIPFRDKMDLLEKAVSTIPDREDIQVVVIDNSVKSMEGQFHHSKKSLGLQYLTSDPTKGAGHARNVGLDHATGKWLLFLDADDYFTEDAFSFFDKYLDSAYDIIFFNVMGVKLATGEPSNRASYISKWIKNGDEGMMRYRCGTPYCKMIRRGLVVEHGIRFQESRVSNDVWFSCMVGHHAKDVKLDASVAYCVTEAPKNASLTKQKSRDNQYTRFQIAVDKNAFLQENGKSPLRARLVTAIFYALRDFGIKEASRYFQYARSKKQNVLTGRGD